tara:strand:+ start:105 stop:1511 length:1407 start_codon:yes stop_codon:yes gene_type:complete
MAVQNKIYRAQIETLKGNSWRVDIRPAKLLAGNTTVEMRTNANGFKLSYKGGGDEFTQPIRGSQVEVVMIIQNKDDEDFIKSIVDSVDQSAVIELSKYDGSNYVSYWTGYLWNNTFKFSYASFPYTVSVKASDSIAMFKNYDGMPNPDGIIWTYFQYVFCGYWSAGTITDDESILLTPAAMGVDYRLRYASTYSVSTAPTSNENFWEYMPVNLTGNVGDILAVHNRTLVISDWLRLWGFRVFLEDGYYKLLDIRQQEKGECTWFNYDSDGISTDQTYESITALAGNNNVIMDGAYTFYKSSARQSVLEYNNTTPNVTAPPNTVTDTRVFSTLGNVRNIEQSLSDVWCYIMQIQYPGSSLVNVTNGISVDDGVTYDSVVGHFQNNQEWLYSTAQKYFNGTIVSKDLNFSKLLIIGNEKFIANSITLTGSLDEWSGEWLKVGETTETPLLSQNSDAEIDTQTGLTNLKVQ